VRRAAAAALGAAALLAGCGYTDDVKDARETIREATEKAREGGKRAVDEADKTLDGLKASDLPADARREFEEAKRLIDRKK